MHSPFSNLRVVDLSTRLSGAFAARLFGDFGAEVLLVEPADGHCLRHEPPFVDNIDDLEHSVVHAYFNWNKDSVVTESASEISALVETADVVITTTCDTDRLSQIADALRPDAVHVSVTPYGLNDPLTGVDGNNLTISAQCGWASINRYRDEAPLQMPRDQSGVIGGIAGFICGAAALRRRSYGESAERADVSELEAFALTVHPWGVASVYHSRSRTSPPGGGRQRGDPAPLWDTSDGRINLGLADFHNWKEAMEACNLPEQGARPELISDFGRHSQDLRDVVWGLARTLPDLKRWDVFHALAKLRCVVGVVQDTREIVEDGHLNDRSYFVQTKVAGRTLSASGAPAILAPSPWKLAKFAPSMGSRPLPDIAPVPRAKDSRSHQLTREQIAEGPLAGIRVLSFGQAWSGTFATELLALLGADVVQVASLHRPDSFRRISNIVPRGVADPTRAQHPRNTQGHYNAVNLHKREITLDLRSDQGKEILWQLLPKFDMVVDNFRPNVLPSWGITLQKLHEIRPGMIWASISGYGETGRYSVYPANGATTEPMAGLSSIHGYEGDVGGMNTGGLYPDPVSGYFLVATVLAALSHRDATGEPQRVDLSMMEAVTSIIGDAIIESDSQQRAVTPRGNHHPRFAPHNTYRAADDEWIAIAVSSDADWARLVMFIGDSRLESDRFRTAAERKKNEDQLDDILSEWCAGRDAATIQRQLTEITVMAARVVPLFEIYARPDPHLAKAGFVQEIEHPEAGVTWLPGRPWRFSAAPSAAIRPSPCVGQHSEEVFREDLGMTTDEYLDLVRSGITGTIDEHETHHARTNQKTAS